MSDPAHSHRMGSYATRGHALGVAVSGNHAYVADSADVSDPTSPRRVGGNTAISARGVVATEDYVCQHRSGISHPAPVQAPDWTRAVVRTGARQPDRDCPLAARSAGIEELLTLARTAVTSQLRCHRNVWKASKGESSVASGNARMLRKIIMSLKDYETDCATNIQLHGC
jgi:hypothetical protein